MTRSLQGSLEELLGRSRVSLSGKPEVNRGAGGIDGTIQVPPVPTLANVGFVDPPGAVGWFQFPPASLVQFGCLALHPAPNGRVVSRETSLHEQFLDASRRDGRSRKRATFDARPNVFQPHTGENARFGVRDRWGNFLAGIAIGEGTFVALA